MGTRLNTEFGMTRIWVRWRFQRLMNRIYPHAYETVYWVESLFGTELRHKALEIARERVELQNKAQKAGQIQVCRR